MRLFGASWVHPDHVRTLKPYVLVLHSELLAVESHRDSAACISPAVRILEENRICASSPRIAVCFWLQCSPPRVNDLFKTSALFDRLVRNQVTVRRRLCVTIYPHEDLCPLDGVTGRYLDGRLGGPNCPRRAKEQNQPASTKTIQHGASVIRKPNYNSTPEGVSLPKRLPLRIGQARSLFSSEISLSK